MIIRTYKKDTIINMDNVLQVTLQGQAINAVPVGSAFSITLGHYKTAEQASRVFEWLMNRIDNNDNVIMPTKDEFE